jgi:hypothetical protein
MQAIVGQEEEDKDKDAEHVEDENNGLVVGVILLLVSVPCAFMLP